MKQLRTLEEILDFPNDPVPHRKALSVLGDDKTYEKEVAELFPRFSWGGRRALRMALIIEEEERKSSPRAQAARIELADDIQYLKDLELLAVLIVLKRGREKLEAIVDLAKATSGTDVFNG